ncbi:M20 family metallopeptidase [Pseudalkalibacillus caeni]|uniref:M20 family metallopeptidase n=1 Tax=Exobacillus caeni TaxID=2574798 RepID=A0A5R9F5X9_9BACL|nr:M20 family metallopeptidase [Pseudalkalibacillus caeni]TLS38947.1 M20 family metallopeptidase [Pseudalkalibacillus caeni]
MDAVQFLQTILKINSSNPPGNEHRVTEVFVKRCKEKGLPYKVNYLEPNRSNFEVTLQGSGTKQLFLCGHMDTVSPGKAEWDYPPFSGEVVEGRIYGRGASDMKSGLAAMYLAIESLYLEKKVPAASVTFLATAGEEVDSCGARAFIEDNDDRRIDALVIGEPTNEKVVIGHKGALWLEITTFGKTSHGSMPEQGINAIDHMASIIGLLGRLKIDWKIEKYPLGESSLAVTMIEGGVQTNVIPDRCTMRVDIRSVPPQSHEALIAELNRELSMLMVKNEIFQYKIRKVLDRPSIMTDPSETLIQTALSIKNEKTSSCYGVSYYTDAAVLNPRSKIPTLIYGPGNEKLAHQPNEWVDIDAYKRSIEFYKTLVLAYGHKSTAKTKTLRGGVL